MHSTESWIAYALVSRDAVDALGSVAAWAVSAVIDVDFAIVSAESSSAFAGVVIDSINALSVVLARVGSAVIDVGDAILTSET